MRRRDLDLFAVAAALVAALLAPAGFKAGILPAGFGDLVAYHYPIRHLTAGALQAGRLPFWNPYIFAGLPLAANPQSVLFYPLSVLGFLFPLDFALSWDMLFHLLWAWAGMTLLARRAGLASASAWALSAMFALSPFLIYRVTEGIPTILACLSWTPWCWLAWASGSAGLLAAVWALQFLSGHPQFLLVNALGMFLWAAAGGEKRRSWETLALGGAGALALAAVQLAPTWEFLAHSVRKGWPEAFMTGYSLELKSLLTCLIPDAWGNPLDQTYAGPPSVFFETSAVYIGGLGLFLACLGLKASRKRAPLLVLLAAGIFLALGKHNPVYLLLLRMGPLSFLRTPSRYLLVTLWGLLLAAGTGLLWAQRAWNPRPAWRLLFAAALLADLVAWDRRFLGAQKDLAARPHPQIAARIAGQPFRLMTDLGLADPDKTMLYRARNVNGYEAFFLAGFPEYAAKSEGKAAVDASRSYLTHFDTPEMSRLGVAFFLDAGGELRPNPKALPLAYFADASGSPLKAAVDLRIERPERWLARGGIPEKARSLILSEAFYPGWKATLAGEPAPLERWDGLVSAVRLAGGGDLDLRFDFVPTGWALWAALSALAWLLWLARLAPALAVKP